MSIVIGVGGRGGGRNNWGRVPHISWHPVHDAGGRGERSGGLGMGGRVDMMMTSSKRDLGGGRRERRDLRPRMGLIRSSPVCRGWMGLVRMRRLLRLRRPGRLLEGGTLELRGGGRKPLGEHAQGVSEGGSAVGGRGGAGVGVGVGVGIGHRGGCSRGHGHRRSPLQANQGGGRLQ